MALAAEHDETTTLGTLPEWRLTDMYDGPDSAALTGDLVEATQASAAFATAYAGKIGGLQGADLGAAVAEYERIDEILSRVSSYAQLVHSGDMSDPEVGRFYQSVVERVTDISTQLVFFTLELNRLDDDALAEKLKAPELARYSAWLRDLRVYRDHQLSDELETLLHEKSVAGRSAWNRLFDETMSGLRFPFKGKELTVTQILERLSSRNPDDRREAAKSLGGTLRGEGRLFALITNTLAKDKEIDDRWRHYPAPVSARNRANQIEDEVVEALVNTVAAHYPQLSHRYYALKAKWFGVEKLDYWDRNAPLPDEADRLIPWVEARDTVLSAYGSFDPRMAAIGRRFFDEGWIDAPARPGKASGAFAHPTVPSSHPYILLNYQGRTRDVMTLAHELGHGVHQVLAADQGHLQSGTPLTLAETASVFGEMLTFQTLLKRETDPKRRKAMLASKVEDMLNTVVRQVSFHFFETRLHAARREGELTPEKICDIWMGIQGESLGPAIRFDDDYRYYWAYIPHFVHTPFYVYAYAFGDCLVNSLYAVYGESETGFAERYLEMLKAGGTLRHGDLLAPFGLNAADPDFWAKGLSMIAGFIDELEQME
ncbi:MAG: M3 family oligoendopeptidase [Alphaproteobacteria bacterium]|nr:M3 family oligoendopeptidase [Alphaproteobacteria bacterium]MBU0795588.1 M3 family oligoendopeptidase [Alphaproteobacteria bacterium]MBU0887645.1 M3 family oligoendopeptidase [Alphaproteobacteria bacterium]MBU1812928.1 M3 family oligoendopeptidase [Alphaproteobacteria bacterium]